VVFKASFSPQVPCQLCPWILTSLGDQQGQARNSSFLDQCQDGRNPPLAAPRNVQCCTVAQKFTKPPSAIMKRGSMQRPDRKPQQVRLSWCIANRNTNFGFVLLGGTRLSHARNDKLYRRHMSPSFLHFELEGSQMTHGTTDNCLWTPS
jgi:hypothetical protein